MASTVDENNTKINELLDAIKMAQAERVSLEAYPDLLQKMLIQALKLTESECGVIWKVLHNKKNIPYLKILSATDIDGNKHSPKLSKSNFEINNELHTLDTLFSRVVLTGEEVIANDPKNDPRRGVEKSILSEWDSLMAVPIYSGDHLIAVIALTDKKADYSKELYDFIKPFLATLGLIISNYLQLQEQSEKISELTNSEKQMRSIFNHAIDSMVLINKQGFIVAVNPAVKKLFGYEPDELIQKNVNVLMPEPYKSEHDSYIKKFLETGKENVIGVSREVNGLHKDGRVIPFELTANKMTVDDNIMFVGVLRDVRKRVAAERALHETTTLQRAILNSANFTIISTDVNGIIKTFNEGGERMLGYDAADLIGKATPLILHDSNEVITRGKKLSKKLNQEIIPGFDVLIAKARLGMPDETEWQFMRKNGESFPVLLSASSLKDNRDNISGYLFIARDITENKKVDTMKNEFVSTVSHELRTPLTSIRGSLGLVASGAIGELPDKINELLQIAINNCERLIRLINDILDLEKIESGKMTFELSMNNLNDVIEKSILENQAYADNYNVKLQFNKNNINEDLLMDSDRIDQVLTNLLSNAIKYSPENEVVTVELEEDASHIKVVVEDKGEGIPVEFQKKLFEKFSQADGSDTRKKGGTGLGLSIVKKIVEKHQGEVGFETKANEGTRFYFTIPKEKLSARVAIIHRKNPSPDSEQQKIQ